MNYKQRSKNMAISKQKKQELVEAYTDLLQRSQGVIWLNNKGLSVSEIFELRSSIREAEGKCKVTKNRLTRLALQNAGLPTMDEVLTGPTITGFALGEIPAVAKAIADFAKENDSVEIKGGLMGTEILSADELTTLANLPPLEILQAQLLGLINAPARQIAGTLSSSVRQVINVVNAYSDSETQTVKT
ncbi:MAG: 50S ribosomal protein L10 [Anaerolineaceae bacterium]|nr:50S ribosomal protein L10 [Anaerolineaceae bacterium]|tara:strand:- start:1722 stop:2285 length:564 start_codon:yes stop_codon:yes gene_type:complete